VFNFACDPDESYEANGIVVHNCIYGHGTNETVMHDGMDDRDKITTPRLTEILADLADIGVKAITFSGGGEPMAHPGIREAMWTCVDRGLDFSFITNGSFLRGDNATLAKRAKWIRVSIDYWDGDSIAKSRGVKPDEFLKIDGNMRGFVDMKEDCELTINFIVTHENHERLLDVATWLRGVGVDNVRFSPVWMDNFHEYHEPIRKYVEEQLAWATRLQTDKFKVYSSYRIDPNAKLRGYDKCWFQQVVPVIGADECVYACHNTAYSDKGRVGSIKGRKFSDLWFSDEAKAWFDKFNAREQCNGIQCAAESKNVLYNEIVNSGTDNFV